MEPAIFKFTGMDNVSDPSKLKEGYSPCLVNVDADDTGGVYQRPSSPFTGEVAAPMACFYSGRDYWALGNEVLYGPSIESLGTRELGGLLADFEVPVTMLVEMVDGLFIGTQNEVIFIAGGDPADGSMTFRQVHTYGVTPGTCCKVQNVDAGIDAPGYSVFFLSHNGICIGTNGGTVKNETTGIVAIPKCTTGSATVRTTRNMTHYIVQVSGQANVVDQFVPITPDDIQ